MLASLLISALLAAWPTGPARAALAGLESADSPDYVHLRYFGFYASAMAHWNFTSELAPWTNLTWIHLGTANDPGAAIPEIVTRVREARSAGVQATLSIEPFLFLNQRGDLRPDAEIEGLLIELRAQLELEGLVGTVAMIYPKDEPFREFIRYRDPSYFDRYVTGSIYEEIHADLVRANDLIKLVFPEKPIGVILSGYELQHRFFSIPENYDWVGFDCYDSLFGGCDEDRSFVRHYERLLVHMQPHQRLMAVPEAWAEHAYTDRADWPDVLRRRLLHHYEIALSEPRFIAFVPFIWSFEADTETPGIGLDRFGETWDDGATDAGSAFVAEVLQIGWEIKRRQSVYPNLAWEETENHPLRPPSNIRASIEEVTQAGRVYAWAVDDALPHKNLRMAVRLRDERGRLLHKSRPERSFVLDHGRGVIATVGLHGFFYQLPRSVLERHRDRALTVEVVVYSDGAYPQVERIERYLLSAGLKPEPPSPAGERQALR
jgi:hypothetical protein